MLIIAFAIHRQDKIRTNMFYERLDRKFPDPPFKCLLCDIELNADELGENGECPICNYSENVVGKNETCQ